MPIEASGISSGCHLLSYSMETVSYTHLIHIVDLMRYFGGEVRDVHAISKYTDPNYETFTTAMLHFENGAAGMLIADRSSGQWEETIEIHGGNHSVQIKMPDSVTVVDGQAMHTTEMTPLAMGLSLIHISLSTKVSASLEEML